MKIQRYAEQEVEYYGGEIGYDYLPIGDVVEMDAAPNRRSREWCVVETPWEGDPRVISYHESRTAALRAVERYRDQFSARNPGGYGYTWDIGRAKDAASAAAKALGSMTSPKKAVSSRANGAKGGRPTIKSLTAKRDAILEELDDMEDRLDVMEDSPDRDDLRFSTERQRELLSEVESKIHHIRVQRDG